MHVRTLVHVYIYKYVANKYISQLVDMTKAWSPTKLQNLLIHLNYLLDTMNASFRERLAAEWILYHCSYQWANSWDPAHWQRSCGNLSSLKSTDSYVCMLPCIAWAYLWRTLFIMFLVSLVPDKMPRTVKNALSIKAGKAVAAVMTRFSQKWWSTHGRFSPLLHPPARHIHIIIITSTILLIIHMYVVPTDRSRTSAS